MLTVSFTKCRFHKVPLNSWLPITSSTFGETVQISHHYKIDETIGFLLLLLNSINIFIAYSSFFMPSLVKIVSHLVATYGEGIVWSDS